MGITELPNRGDSQEKLDYKYRNKTPKQDEQRKYSAGGYHNYPEMGWDSIQRSIKRRFCRNVVVFWKKNLKYTNNTRILAR